MVDEVKEIPVGQLGVDSMNVRSGDWDDDQELVESIKKLGIMYPLLVRVGTSKRKVSLKYTIVCGSRRYHAALSAGMKTVPCIIKELSDLDAIGISLTENLKRNNLNGIQIAESIAKIWEMMNGGKSYEEKVAEINKRFGFSRQSVDTYLSISRLADSVKRYTQQRYHGGVKDAVTDTHVLADVARTWDKQRDQMEAVKILEGEENKREVLQAMKKYSETMTPAQAFSKVKELRHGEYKHPFFNSKIAQALDEASIAEKRDSETIIIDATERYLKWKKYL
jgi:ParB/RepB/Spo0J family partition protein